MSNELQDKVAWHTKRLNKEFSKIFVATPQDVDMYEMILIHTRFSINELCGAMEQAEKVYGYDRMMELFKTSVDRMTEYLAKNKAEEEKK